MVLFKLGDDISTRLLSFNYCTNNAIREYIYSYNNDNVNFYCRNVKIHFDLNIVRSNIVTVPPVAFSKWLYLSSLYPLDIYI